jgi:hypothetical protein
MSLGSIFTWKLAAAWGSGVPVPVGKERKKGFKKESQDLTVDVTTFKPTNDKYASQESCHCQEVIDLDCNQDSYDGEDHCRESGQGNKAQSREGGQGTSRKSTCESAGPYSAGDCAPVKTVQRHSMDCVGSKPTYKMELMVR